MQLHLVHVSPFEVFFLCRNLNYGKKVFQKINRKKQQAFSMLSKGKVKEYWMSHFHQPTQAALVMLMICILSLTLKNIMLFLKKLLIYCTKQGMWPALPGKFCLFPKFKSVKNGGQKKLSYHKRILLVQFEEAVA